MSTRPSEHGGVFAFTLLTGAFVAGCVNTSPDRVKSTTHIEQAQLSVTKGPLVTSIGGSFDFVIAIGDLASSDDVIGDAPTFQLVGAGEQAGPGLDALPPSGTFPLTLRSGAQKSITFALTDQNTITAAETSVVCAGPVRIVATYRDSLGGDRAISTESDPTTVAGCSP
jgi:hypothetical protein